MGSFKPAVRGQRKLKVGLIGPTGAGKTYTALSMARALAGPKGRVAFLDTENHSATLYVGQVDRWGQRFEFDHADLSDTRPERYIDLVQEAERAQYDVVVIDSASHAWAAILDFVDSKSNDRGGKFGAGWRLATPRWRAFVEALVRCNVHLIVCARAKMQYVIDERNNPQRVGMGAEMRAGFEYELDVIGEFIAPTRLEITKTRNSEIAGKVYDRPGKDLADELLAWSGKGLTVDEEMRQLLGEDFELLDPFLDAEGKGSWSSTDEHNQLRLLDWLRQRPRKWVSFVELNVQSSVEVADDSTDAHGGGHE